MIVPNTKGIFSPIFLPVSFSLLSLISPLQYDMTVKSTSQSQPSNHLRQLNETKLQSFDDLYHIMTLRVCIGIPQQCFDFLYDTGMMYTIVGDNTDRAQFAHKFNCGSSQSYRTINSGLYTLAYRYGIINAREVCDYCLLGEKKPPYTFNFLVAYNTTTYYDFDGILGLGHRYPMREDGNSFDERFSFLQYLKFNKLIENKIFAHQYLNRTYGKFYIDEIPQSFGKDYKKCSLSYSESFLYKWYCMLRTVSLSNGKAFNIKSAIAFDTGYIDIRGPMSEGEEMLNSLVEAAGGRCSIQEEKIDDTSSYKRMICKDNLKISNIPDIYFNLDEGKMVLFSNDMFRLVEINGERKYVCKIILDSRYNYWNIGEPVIKNYDMIFNADQDYVGFKENLNFYGESWVSVIILAIVFVGVIGLGVWVFLNRKKLFNKGLASDQIEKLKHKEAFDGAQLGDI